MSLLPKPIGLTDDIQEEINKRKKKGYKTTPMGTDKLNNLDGMDDASIRTIKDYVAAWDPRAQFKVAKTLQKKYGADVGVVYVLNEIGEASFLFFGGAAVGTPYLILAAPLINSEAIVLSSYLALRKRAKREVKGALGWFDKATKDERKAIGNFLDEFLDGVDLEELSPEDQAFVWFTLPPRK